MNPTKKRPRDPERPRRIIDAARALAREVGVGQITHRAVAERADVPLGSTTYYFDTIEDMLAQAIRLDIAEFMARMKQVLAQTEGQDPVERVLAIMQRENHVIHDFAGGYDLYLNALARPALRPLAVEWGDAIIAALETFLTHDQAVAVAVFLDGHGIRAILLGAPDLPDDVLFRRQLQGLLG